MKNPNTLNSKKGFTLVELLVVIAIIAVLAAAGFAGGTAAMNKARKVTAQASATSVQTAIEQFYAEYSALPDVEEQTDTSEGELLNILAGLEGTGNNIQNDRKIRFLSLKESKNGKRDGVVYSANGSSIDSLLDPWGQPFYVVLDTDYDDQIRVTPQGSSAVTLNGRRAAVYSLGVESVGEAKPSTLVKTW
ncbi:prepilin-type N-terminal cleavage/methylation domain-containing protein [Luteolibacter algae]|uniref:Prepilin-type N-terminal cleavage/methylation domain-containing protein n=1 Tax=Luteolibacter algae TaxID=454151 RepID=A0ABW5DAM2_9BACT